MAYGSPLAEHLLAERLVAQAAGTEFLAHLETEGAEAIDLRARLGLLNGVGLLERRRHEPGESLYGEGVWIPLELDLECDDLADLFPVGAALRYEGHLRELSEGETSVRWVEIEVEIAGISELPFPDDSSGDRVCAVRLELG